MVNHGDKEDSHTGSQLNLDLSLDGAWVTTDDRKFLWLPKEYRTRYFAQCGSLLVLLLNFGSTAILHFQ